MTEQFRLPLFPFSAIVGQHTMKLALILNTIDPKVGGVLIKGEKGTAKSTAVRALAKLLPPIKVVADCPYHCDPDDESNLCDNCRETLKKGVPLQTKYEPFSFVNVPLGVTEDRLIGTLNLEKVLKDGKRYFQPGLLAKANRGILYIDEVNLLEDHLVDELLDVAAMGINLVEREGISFSHPSRFILVGTMNPEEGELRPQFLDRFGLCVHVETIKNQQERMEIARRRTLFENQPQKFIKEWQKEDKKLSRKIVSARKLLNVIEDKDWFYELVSKICILSDIDGHRADNFILRAAKAYAAFEGRRFIIPEDFLTVTALVLPHRLKKKPFEDDKDFDELNNQIIATVKEYKEKTERGNILEYREKKN